MQHDEVIWQVINHHHCSFKVTTKIQGKETQNFCRNKYNVTGLCNRSSCPLANSRYATVIEEKGRCYLYMKTIERAHSPKNLWQRVKLNRNYAKALTQLDTHLEFWPKFLVHKNKQRLTKITQYLIRMKRLALKVKPKLVTVPARTEKRERRREAKAESAANIDREIEKELLQRLQSGTYADIYNFPVKQYNKVLDKESTEAEMETEQDSEMLSDEDQGEVNSEDELGNLIADEEEDDDSSAGEIEYVEGYDDLYTDDIESFGDDLHINTDATADDAGDDSDDEPKGKKRAAEGKGKRPAGKRSGKKSRKSIEVEYEHEHEHEHERGATNLDY
eukprot:CAMPEP_0198242844 /NCGR_PEP_ID=MMETSP1446-20131203/21689_1 /TAXON_ID=1461542 ORGANISM="Unidentified sp, Strain CCMP2111" /NCGR_SAMPLE_ID=MMETSP1446 /ASSEMBLY_ACC=CAM_ASM_001112 /LENGTH=332 /DNA_ID=CAMNT_0043926475 /DNA_START=66 /DNA_END=1064 /DNA_ORIENTATION=+